MARRRRHLAVALVVFAGSVGGTTAYAAWSATTSTPNATFTSKADWVAPVVGTNTIHKGNGTGKVGYFNSYVKAGNQFWVYANINESGNPASGFAASGPVTANLTNLGASATGALTSGSCSSQGGTYNWCGGPVTGLARPPQGTKNHTFPPQEQGPKTAHTR